MTDQTPMQIPQGYMKNARGELIPETRVRPEDKIEDALVRELCTVAISMNVELEQFKANAFEEISAFRTMIAEKYGATKGGAKGNMTLRSFDGSFEVQVAVSEAIDLHSPQLQAAKELIDNCVTRWSKGANDQLQALVDHAFQVNKEGRIDTHRVLSLRQLEMNDAEWDRAMTAIEDAIRVTGSRTYIRFYKRDAETERREAIPLDIAAV